MWQELINIINNDPTISGIIANFIGGSLSMTVSSRLKQLFKKKHDSKEKNLTIEDCKDLKISEKELKALLEEVKQLKNNKVVIRQDNEEGNNVNEVCGLSKANKDVDISQTNKKTDNNLKIAF